MHYIEAGPPHESSGALIAEHLQDASSCGLREAQRADAHFGNVEHARVIGDRAHLNCDLVLLCPQHGMAMVQQLLE